MLGVVALAFVAVVLTAGIVEAAHRSAPYRQTVNQSFAAAASVLLVSSNQTGTGLQDALSGASTLGRVLLESRLQGLAQQASEDAHAAESLTPPPPDAGAADRVIDTLRLRDRAVTSIRSTIEGLLGLTPTNPVGTAGAAPVAAPRVAVPGAERLLKYAGEQLVLADHIYRGLPVLFLARTGASLPRSQWTSPKTGELMPETLLEAAGSLAAAPQLAASIRLRIVAVATKPQLLPIGAGYPIQPTREFSVAISVENAGSAPTIVEAVIRATPLGTSPGHFDSGRASGAVDAEGAVALQLPAMAVVPGEHCLVTIELARPPLQTRRTGLRWARVVVVGQEP